MSLRKRVDSGQINRDVFECWCAFKGSSPKTVFYEEELYSRWCRCLLASIAILIVAGVGFPLLLYWVRPGQWTMVILSIFCALAGALSLFFFAMIAYHYDPERVFDEDWSGLTGPLDTRPDVTDGARSLAKQIEARLQAQFEGGSFTIRRLQAALLMFTEKVYTIS